MTLPISSVKTNRMIGDNETETNSFKNNGIRKCLLLELLVGEYKIGKELSIQRILATIGKFLNSPAKPNEKRVVRTIAMSAVNQGLSPIKPTAIRTNTNTIG